MKEIDYYCNFILYNTINKALLLFNKCISCNITYRFNYQKIERTNFKNNFTINYNTLEKTKDKKIFKIINKKVLFKYDY